MALLGAGGSVLYMSGPAGPPPDPSSAHDDLHNSGRKNMVVYESKDGGANFKAVARIPGYAGYSSLAMLPTGDVGLIYETNTADDKASGCVNSCSIVYRTVSSTVAKII